ncbi:hypothetical protein CIHG_08238 [Coccidioides immitis H538.4]|uniref:Uncharacterized protein n=2 Tax=Coccidioides immitis TaxID=5501 RepID=A0A0J8URY0_COCIT|nr:hypothetical protein CIRG_04304 [Coccidioides immitis RMSCC 2394]KMU90428.1 hypothetical protein CIHG_08238 [Coccidioides immitis H538.4]
MTVMKLYVGDGGGVFEAKSNLPFKNAACLSALPLIGSGTSWDQSRSPSNSDSPEVRKR